MLTEQKSNTRQNRLAQYKTASRELSGSRLTGIKVSPRNREPRENQATSVERRQTIEPSLITRVRMSWWNFKASCVKGGGGNTGFIS